MTLETFRERHSLLIEHYQFIEFHLEGIYAFLNDKGFFDGIKVVEKTNLQKLFDMVQVTTRKNNLQLFSEEDMTAIQNAIQRRNYWVHECYTVICTDGRSIKKQSDVDLLEKDIREACRIREMLYEIVLKISHR